MTCLRHHEFGESERARARAGRETRICGDETIRTRPGCSAAQRHRRADQFGEGFFTDKGTQLAALCASCFCSDSPGLDTSNTAPEGNRGTRITRLASLQILENAEIREAE